MDFQEFLENDQKLTILQVTEKLGQVTISAVVFYRIPISLQTADDDNKKSFQLQIDIYEFLDNQQFSGLDTFCNQIGQSVYMLSDELEDVSSRVLAKKLNMLFEMRNLERKFIKKSLFLRKGSTVLEKFSQRSLITESLVSAIELERNLSISCLECLAQLFDLPASFPEDSTFEMKIKSLDSFMRLDTPASDAINLLPKPDQPSIYGSLYGILNRCKTKMGQKTLERWLRQPLLSKSAIDERLNLVELFSLNTIARNKLRDGPLKNIPDLDTVSSKLRKKTAGLQEMFRLYLFVKSLPLLLQILQELNPAANQTEMNEDSNDNDDTKSQELFATLQSKYLTSLQQIAGKFALYEQLIEHVIDFDALPDYKINPKHDPELQELAEEQKGLEIRAEKVLNDAKASYASFAEVRLERSSQYGFNLRTTKGDDEKQLRANNSSVRILSILKNGTHFTTPILERISDRYLTIEREYHEKQQELVDKALATALTYLPLIESVAVLVSEIDVLQSFAQAAALSPNGYIRPTILPRGSGILKLHNARHPCVELMDNVTFIANDYEMIRDQSNFQIITGPNMGGKSTYIRGIGSIVVMAQIGMFVPCEMAEISIVDCILARVGAGDAVQKGVSTFMAEMLESSVILNAATKDSLIIIDELGRGTSTYDGFGIAWAMSDFITTKINCFCLFATHFHEITALAHHHKGVVNKHVSAHVEEGRELVMLYQLRDGPCTESFGVFVAQSAGFPKEVIQEAKRKAHVLEGKAHLDEDDEKGHSMVKQGKEKMRKMRHHLDEFSGLNVPAMPSTELKSILGQLFPAEMLISH